MSIWHLYVSKIKTQLLNIDVSFIGEITIKHF